MDIDIAAAPKVTAAFYIQAAASFVVALLALAVGIFYLPVGGWIRAFLGLGLAYVVTSAFTLAKTIRDAQEVGTVVRRVDQARIDNFISQHDPFKTTATN
ncbi:YiaA/YiaB family inner membrane protein [Actinoplanes sp. M2I2]|uniref:YiaA/YiaB family inner membrane protein n=1 Tax=Actinoplanes sp. M2I2 TaxID=1734444 RepID=UPI002020965B|nr:YiaA/YiaB family inner membrane protein [Actinoplanes sp. M2I2]